MPDTVTMTTSRRTATPSGDFDHNSVAPRPRTATPRVVFFCGHKSPYGLAHLEAIIEHFDVQAVVLATDERWTTFRTALLGKAPPSTPLLQRVRSKVRCALTRALPISLQVPVTNALGFTPDVVSILKSRDIPCWHAPDVSDPDFIARCNRTSSDLFLCAAYPQLLPREIIDTPRLGSVNFHPSLLPAYRGAHPHFWAIARGERHSGVSAHFMTERLDDGDIVGQIAFPIDDLTYSGVYARINQHTGRLVQATVEFFRDSEQSAIPQNTESTTSFRNDREIHHRIFWNSHTSQQIHNLCRTERAFCFFRDRRIVLLNTSYESDNRNLTNSVHVESGTIVDLTNDTVIVKARDGVVGIEMLNEGKKPISASHWIKRRKPRIGEKFV